MGACKVVPRVRGDNTWRSQTAATALQMFASCTQQDTFKEVRCCNTASGSTQARSNVSRFISHLAHEELRPRVARAVAAPVKGRYRISTLCAFAPLR